MKALHIVAGALASALVLAGAGFAYYKLSDAPQSAAAIALTEAEKASIFYSHASNANSERCLATYSKLGTALTAGSAFTAQTITPSQGAKNAAISGLVGMQIEGIGQGGEITDAFGLAFAAPSATACQGLIVKVVPVAVSCELASQGFPAGSNQQDSLLNVQNYTLAGGGRAVLIPAATGCVAISIGFSGS